MLTEVEIQNFKSLADKVTFSNLQDVNVLVGENNSGKSSLLQVLNFIKLSVVKKDLVWSDKKTGFYLGSFDEVIYNSETNRNLVFTLSFKCKVPKKVNKSIKNTEYEKFDFSVIRWTISITKSQDSVFVDKEIIEDNKHDEIFCINNRFESTPSVTFSFEEKNLSIGKMFNREGPLNWNTSLKSFPGMDDYEVMMRFIRNFLKEQVTNMFFLSIDRINKDWSSPVDREPFTVGPKGEEAVPLFHYIFSGKQGIYKKINSTIRDILGSKKIESPLLSPLHNGNAEIRLETEGLTHHPNIINCGGGLNQLIPLNILCYDTPKNSILLIEEPELCLHPKASNRQFSIFFTLQNEGKQVFLTTHSITNLFNLLKQGRDKKNARIFFLKLEKTRTTIDKEYLLPKDTKKYDKDLKLLISSFLGFTG